MLVAQLIIAIALGNVTANCDLFLRLNHSLYALDNTISHVSEKQ